MTVTRRTVLISGASISGPALAYWLNRAGFAVTVVEKAGALRAGGYPIDIRGTAIEVVRRMGILPELRAAHIDSRRFTFLDADGAQVASIGADSNSGGQDLEVRRGDLARSLYALVRHDVEFRFNDSIEEADPTGDALEVTFRSGHRRTFDLMIGADGMHSQTRASRFGPEEQFHHPLGYGFAIFTLPNTLGLSHELMMWNTPGRAAALYAVGDSDELHAFLTFHASQAPLDALRDPGAQRDLIASVYADAGWEVPRLLQALRTADDLYIDTVSQIRMPHWSSGRVALVGDAAYAPSFLTGQGSSLALAGAYLLARALGENPDHTAAFAAYEHDLRPFVDANQALVGTGTAPLFPVTAQALEQRNTMLRGLQTMPAGQARPEHSALRLPAVAAA